MPTTTINRVVEIFDKKHNICLTKLPSKKIIYTGNTKNNKSIVVIMPSSKIYPRGNGWVDFTKIQIDLLKQYEIAIVVFRLSNEKNYFVNMKGLFSLLSDNNMITNNKEGEHWKLDIWEYKIVVRNGGETLSVKPNESQFINELS
jgi:hypothetical protein